MKKNFFLILAVFIVTTVCFADITNIAKISELSRDGVAELCPYISNDGLRMYYLIRKSASDQTLGEYAVASRSSLTDPFDNVTSSPFVNVWGAGYEGSLRVSDDGLRLYFASTRDGLLDIFFASRASTSDPFPTPVKMPVINDSSGGESVPILCNNELTMYFISDRTISNVYDVYRATRSSITSDFSAPEQITEIPGYQYYLFDVSEDELKMVLLNTDASSFYYTDRSSTSEPFGSPQLVKTIGSYLTAGSMNSDWSKIYYGHFDGGYILDMDLYYGDFAPPVPPTPTPTPNVPKPVPEITMAANKDQIETLTSSDANPWGGAFDSNGDYIFFDQGMMPDPYSSPYMIGSNSLVRLSSPGSSPSFSSIVTRSEFASFDSRWNTDIPVLQCLDVLSDDSIVMLVFFPAGGLQKLMRIVPGSPAQISTIANWDTSPYMDSPLPITVDRSANPNIIYISYYTQIFKITADQVNATISSEWTHASDSYIYDMVIEADGNVIAGGASLSGYRILRYDKNTGLESIVVDNLDAILNGFFSSTVALAKNPTNDDIFGLYKSNFWYPWTLSKFNIFKLSKGTGGAYTAADYVTGYQVLTDSDIAPYASYPTTQLVTPGQGFAIDPSGNFLFVSNGRPEIFSYYDGAGSRNIISISTTAVAGADPSWKIYE